MADIQPFTKDLADSLGKDKWLAILKYHDWLISVRKKDKISADIQKRKKDRFLGRTTKILFYKHIPVVSGIYFHYYIYITKKGIIHDSFGDDFEY